MSLRNELIKQISEDLRLYKYEDEKHTDFLNRLIYSAVGSWILHSTNDQDVKDNYKKSGVSKAYITRKVSKVVAEYVALFPSFGNFLGGITESEFVAQLREIYERAGYIVPTGFDEFVTSSASKEASTKEHWSIIRNGIKHANSRAVGLGVFLKEKEEAGSEEDCCGLDELFYLTKTDAKRWTDEYVRKLKWINAAKLDCETQYFDPQKISCFNECWIEKFPIDCKVTLYKTNNWDYGFAKKDGLDVLGVKIPEFLIGNNTSGNECIFAKDVRRFMYGLKAIKNTNAICFVQKKTGYKELKLLNALPIRELTVLQFLGWRKNGFSDEYNYIIPFEMFDTVKKILANLSMRIIEEK